jgi:hypothetical protein
MASVRLIFSSALAKPIWLKDEAMKEISMRGESASPETCPSPSPYLRKRAIWATVTEAFIGLAMEFHVIR